MASRRLWLCAVVPAALAAGLAAVAVWRPPHVSTSLYGLIGREAERIPQFVRDQSGAEIAVIVSSTNRAAAVRTAEAVRDRHEPSPAVPEGAIAFLRRERAGLVAPETAHLLQTAEGRAKVARRAVRRLYASPVPPLLGFADDPFGLADAYLAALPRGRETLETNGVTHVLVKLRYEPKAGLPDAADLSSDGVRVRLCGAPVHAALAEARCRREINVLTAFSLAFIALLSLAVFRSVRWIPLLGCSLLVSALAGGIVLCAAFREIHLMSLVFGTTVLGLVIDYSFHWLLADPSRTADTRRNLLLSFLTTEISLLPLVLASVPVLRQSAAFLSAGLAAALLLVLFAYPPAALPDSPVAVRKPRIGARVVCALVAAAALAGVFGLRVGTDVTAVYRSPSELLEAERLRAAFGTFDFAALPSKAARAAVIADVRKLYAEQGETLRRELALEKLEPPPAPTYDFVAPRVLLDGILSAWTRETLVRLGLALALMFVALACFFRRRAWRVFAPSGFALLAVAGLLSLGGVTLNLFHLLAGFLLAGMGIDYTVFLHAKESGSMRSVVCSLLTSMAGFGALAFVSMPVVASFGQVLGLGLPISFLAALALAPANGAENEQAASPLGLEILWCAYRLFGLRFLHVLAALVGACAWLFAPAVRKASPTLGKVASFTRSLADKLVVMANGRRLPTVVPDASPDAQAFLEDVRQGRGVFILSSHVGTIEVLVALGACERTFHAWMDFDRTSVFTRFYLRHARRTKVALHPIASFDMGSVFEAGDQLDAGDCVLMAGDRGDGAFRLAAAFDHPVYLVACLYEGRCRYRAVVRRLPAARKEMKSAYDAAVRELAKAYPNQDYTFGAAAVAPVR